MSWRQYQEKARTTKSFRKNNSAWKAQFVALAIGLFAFVGVAYGLLAGKENAGTEASTPKVDEKPQDAVFHQHRPNLAKVLNVSEIENGVSQVRIARDGIDRVIDLTIDQDIQQYIQKRLARYRVDWGGVAVVDAGSGAVLALASHSEKEPEGKNLALRATFPAASIFKVVTAAATIAETDIGRGSLIGFDGNAYGIKKRQVVSPGGRTKMTVSRAFAKSSNVVFGKLGAHYLSGKMLSAYAFRFGFNVPIPFDLEAGISRLEPLEDSLHEKAKLAAGFGKVTLSPLHGALIASAIVNGGKMMEPYLVRQVSTGRGQVEYLAKQKVWGEPISLQTARELKQMMTATISVGTARRHFRRIARDKVLSRLDIGGKTGSLTGRNPRGKTEWFVGYARGPVRKIAVGVVLVSEKKWRVKPSALSKEIFRHAFSSRPSMHASASTGFRYGP